MPKTKPAASAEKDAEEESYIYGVAKYGPKPAKIAPAMTPEKLHRFLTSRDEDVKARTIKDEPCPSPPTRGPMTGGRNPVTELQRLITPNEAQEFLTIIRERRARTETAWMKCNKCGFVGKFRTSTIGGACQVCNRNSLAWGGHMAAVSDAEAMDYYDKKAREEAEALARMEKAALASRNQERAKGGLEPLSLAQFRAENRAIGQRRLEDDRKLQELTAKNRAARAAGGAR